MLKALVIVAGAAITIGWAMIEGHRLHLWTLKHAPGVAAWIPRCVGGAGLGLAIGALIVARWAAG